MHSHTDTIHLLATLTHSLSTQERQERAVETARLQAETQQEGAKEGAKYKAMAERALAKGRSALAAKQQALAEKHRKYTAAVVARLEAEATAKLKEVRVVASQPGGLVGLLKDMSWRWRGKWVRSVYRDGARSQSELATNPSHTAAPTPRIVNNKLTACCAVAVCVCVRLFPRPQKRNRC